MTVKLYMSSVSSNMEIKKNQQKIQMVLEGKKIPFNIIDIAADSTARTEMREGCGNNTALPPQIFNDNNYCGDFNAFIEAVECETLNEFLKLEN